MHETQDNNQINGAVLVLGMLIAATAIGVAGKAFYERTQAGSEKRDINDIISHCHQTIHEMEAALQRL